MSITAMKEMANYIDALGGDSKKYRQAIEQSEKQEPYGYFRYDIRLDAWVQSRDSNKGVAFYTTPPAAQRECENCGEFGPCCQKQEPATVVKAWHDERGDSHLDFLTWHTLPDGEHALYTTPQPQQWVGLTDEDIEQEFGFIDELLRDCVYRTEAKLKEKNT